MPANPRGIMRLQKEYKMLAASRPPIILAARPDEANLFDCYFVIDGPSGTPFEGGRYTGLLRFPSDYPMSPPSVLILTANGRFKTNTPLCMSNTDFHKKEWVPTWSIETILLGFVSFLVDTDAGTHGALEQWSPEVIRRHAVASHKVNDQILKFRTLFPELVGYRPSEEAQAATAANANAPSLTSGPTPVVAALLAVPKGAAPGRTVTENLWNGMFRYGAVLGLFAFAAQLYRSVLERLS